MFGFIASAHSYLLMDERKANSVGQQSEHSLHTRHFVFIYFLRKAKNIFDREH